MKTGFGIFLVIVGLITLVRYPNFGKDIAESLGALLGIGLITFLPGVLLIKNDNKK